MNNDFVQANILIVQGGSQREIVLRKRSCVLGRIAAPDVDIVCDASIVSRHHGRFYFEEGEWFYEDLDSSNGSFVNENHVHHDPRPCRMVEGTTIRIDDERALGKQHAEGVLIFFHYGDLSEKYFTWDLRVPDGSRIFIGRDPSCHIRLDTITVSRRQGYLSKEGGRLYFVDGGSTNGTFLNGTRTRGRVPLSSQDVLLMGNIKMIFLGDRMIFRKPQAGNYLSIRGMTRIVKDYNKRGQKKMILCDVNADIAEGQLVAILGTSGAGKTTFMNCVIGYEPPTRGTVKIDGANLYADKKLLKQKIGYVPQEDLLRGGLSMEKTLDYIGRLRLPKDVSREERRAQISRILDDLDLGPNLRKSHIRKLSGGQRKRVSIASELISDPPLLFLDEPTSGLDPETETKLVFLLQKLAHDKGKTLMVVTHTIRNIMEFDQVLFFGPGGKLCYSGTPQNAMRVFDVEDFADIYPLVSNNPDRYAEIQKRKLVRNER